MDANKNLEIYGDRNEGLKELRSGASPSLQLSTKVLSCQLHSFKARRTKRAKRLRTCRVAENGKAFLSVLQRCDAARRAIESRMLRRAKYKGLSKPETTTTTVTAAELPASSMIDLKTAFRFQYVDSSQQLR